MDPTYLATYAPVKYINETEGFLYQRIGVRPPLPITASELQAHIRVDVPLEQPDYLNLLIGSVVHYAESYIGLNCLPTQWLTYRDNFEPNAFELRKGYFQSLQSFQYLARDTMIWTDVDPTLYQVALRPYYSQILLLAEHDYPFRDTARQQNAIEIKFTSGLSDIPANFALDFPDLKIAMLDHCAFEYENRGNDIGFVRGDAVGLPPKIEEVYERYKVPAAFGGVIFNINW